MDHGANDRTVAALTRERDEALAALRELVDATEAAMNAESAEAGARFNRATLAANMLLAANEVAT